MSLRVKIMIRILTFLFFFFGFLFKYDDDFVKNLHKYAQWTLMCI